MRFWLLFFALFLLQASIWPDLNVLDQGIWLQRIALHEKNLQGLPLASEGVDFTHSNSPNFSVLTAAVAVGQLGFTHEQALTYSLSFFIALAATWASYCAYRLQPQNLWWAVVFGILGFNYLIFSVSPPSAVSTALISWLLLAGLLAHQQPKSKNLALFGLVAGISFLTRWPAAVVVAGPLALLLLGRVKTRRLWPAVTTFLLSVVVLAPFILTDPSGLIKIMFVRSLHNFDPLISSAVLDVPSLMISGLVGLISIFLAVIYFYRGKDPQSKTFIVTCVGLTAIYVAVFSSIAAPALRHWYPLLLGWEVLLPYWILKLVPFNTRLQTITNLSLVLGSTAVTLAYLW